MKSVSGLLDLLLGVFSGSSESDSVAEHCALVQQEPAGVPPVMTAFPDLGSD
jgi:hypothetical protein